MVPTFVTGVTTSVRAQAAGCVPLATIFDMRVRDEAEQVHGVEELPAEIGYTRHSAGAAGD